MNMKIKRRSITFITKKTRSTKRMSYQKVLLSKFAIIHLLLYNLLLNFFISFLFCLLFTTDIRSLSPQEQQRRIKWRAFSKMVMGSVVLLLFSEPTINVIRYFFYVLSRIL